MEVLVKAQIDRIENTVEACVLHLSPSGSVTVNWHWRQIWRPTEGQWVVVTKDNKAHMYVPVDCPP